MLMLAATGIVIISLGVAFFIFRPHGPDLAFIPLALGISTVSVFGMVGMTRTNAPRQKHQDVSNRV
jgi:hypothetical protein